jgi:hypothetical protein
LDAQGWGVQAAQSRFLRQTGKAGREESGEHVPSQLVEKEIPCGEWAKLNVLELIELRKWQEPYDAVDDVIDRLDVLGGGPEEYPADRTAVPRAVKPSIHHKQRKYRSPIP